MVSVSPDRVRDRVNLTSSDISDAKVTEFVLDAEVEVELETDLEIDCLNCSQAEAACITDLAALYCLAYITGGSASGTSFTLGDLSVKEVTGGVEGPSPAFLQQRVLKLIERLKGSSLRRI
ncbi:MAG TPA: hypothetical protein ENN36_00065 [Candidatus Bathyarchaeota archaeon]|nr:hypothetical protein [Candidatus Bathyarchaeota archaeon]